MSKINLNPKRDAIAPNASYVGFPSQPAQSLNGSRDPLSVDGHWDWRNPFNLLPLGVLVLALLSVLLLLI